MNTHIYLRMYSKTHIFFYKYSYSASEHIHTFISTREYIYSNLQLYI